MKAKIQVIVNAEKEKYVAFDYHFTALSIDMN